MTCYSEGWKAEKLVSVVQGTGAHACCVRYLSLSDYGLSSVRDRCEGVARGMLSRDAPVASGEVACSCGSAATWCLDAWNNVAHCMEM